MAFEFGALGVIAVLAWLWLASLNARDAAVEAARRACAADGVQFLDDTVMLASIRPARDGDGGVVLRRVYRFEFSDTGDNRLAGAVTLSNARVDTLYLEPHRAGGDDAARRVVNAP